MAHLLLSHPLPGSSPEAIRLFQVLKRLPDSYFVTQRLSALHGPGPDFLLIHETQQAILLAVSPATMQDVQAALQPALFAAAPAEPIGAAETAVLHAFQSSLNMAVPGAILFPHLDERNLSSFQQRSFPWLDKSLLTPQELAAWLPEHLSAPLENDAYQMLRQRFAPETTVPQTFTVRRPPTRNLNAAISAHLLDYNQERAMKAYLTLPSDGQSAAQEFGLRLVNGVAGSGKSLIIIYRARLLRQLFPHWRILVLTHNRALNRDLRRRYWQLSGSDDEVGFHTFMGWCRKYWPEQKPWRDPIHWPQRRQIIAETWHEHLAETAVSEQMLQEEIDWYKDRLLFTREAYLAADRSGRGFALQESMRLRVYEAMVAYHQRLQQLHTMDWGDVPRQIWRFLEAGELDLLPYDAILVDEAQFFAPLWFEIIKRLLKPQTSHLFLVADPSQGFLKRRQSWLASGLVVRGHTYQLNRSYRTTREILDFATLLYRMRLPQDDEEMVAPNLRHMPHGTVPILIPLSSTQDEITRVVNEIRALHEAAVPWEHILVIHASWEETRPLLQRLRHEFGPETAVDPGQATPKGQMRVCSLNGATGLESPIVFIMGLHTLYEQEQSVRLSDEERLDLIRDNTRRLYMAITRAGQRLVLTSVGDVSELRQAFARQLLVQD